jgi:hypothetical protein
MKAAGGRHHERNTKNIDDAELANATRKRMLKAATGPRLRVMGDARKPSNGTDVVLARSTPCGKSRNVE